MSACKANSAFEGESASFMAVLLVNCTFTALMALAPTFLASAEVSLPFALMLRRNEPRSPRRTLLPFCKASITSYYSASSTAFTSALDTVLRFSMRFTICANVTGVVGAICG